MKNILLASSILVFTSSCFAFSLEASLKKNMKQVGKAVKAVSQQIEDPSKNADSIAKLSDVEELLKKAQTQMPDSIEKLDKAKQDESFKKYKEMIQQELDLTASLKTSLQANDNAKAKSVLKEMNDLKKKGHKEFDPED